MEKLRSMVNEIAYTPRSRRFSNLSPFQLSLIPILSLTSSLYKLILSLRHHLYRFALLPKHRLPVPVISVGNLTWGGNGKTPMVEFISHWLADCGIPPLILTRGYGGADEAKMLQRHLDGTSAKIGVGANRAATAASFLQRCGHTDLSSITCVKSLSSEPNGDSHLDSNRIGVAILDDGMQHLSLRRDVEILMVNGMRPWGNRQLLPIGPLREPLRAISRADIVVVHHADMISEQEIEAIELTIREVKISIPIYFSRMTPSYFCKVDNFSCRLPLGAIRNMTVLCVSAIGFADSFVLSIEKMGPMHVDRIDFSDHHLFHIEDVEKIRMTIQKLMANFDSKPIIITTEKDFDRDPKIFRHLETFEVLVLCSRLHIVNRNGFSDESFRDIIKQQLMGRYR